MDAKEMTLDQYQAEQKRKAAERKEKQLKQQEQRGAMQLCTEIVVA